MPAQNNPNQRSVTDTLTLLWAANESFAGAFLHALNIPFKGIYLTGFSLLMLRMIAESTADRFKLISSGAKVSAVKAVINPFASVNSHLAVMFQSFAASILLSGKRTSQLQLLILSITAMMFTALQRLFLLWLFYGMVLYDAVNIFLEKVIGEFNFWGSASSDYSLLLVFIYLASHLSAGVAVSRFIFKFSQNSLDISGKDEFDLNLEKSLTQSEPNFYFVKRRIKWIIPLLILFFVAGVTYTFTSQNIIVILTQSALRFVLAFLFLILLRLLYVSFVKRHSKTDKAISETIDDVRKMKFYFSLAFARTKQVPLSEKPEMFFRTLLFAANLQSSDK